MTAAAAALSERRGLRLPGLAGSVFWLVLLALVALIIVAPLASVMDTALRADARFGISAHHTIDTLVGVYTSADYLGTLIEALVLSCFVTLFAVGVGLTLALLIARTDMPGKGLMNILVVMPMFLSPFNGLIAWISLASERTGFLNLGARALCAWLGLGAPPALNILSYSGAVWVMFLFFTPYVYLFTIASLRSMDSSLEEAARTCGASGLRTLALITVPVCLPAILAAVLLVFILAAETYTIPGMIGSSAGFTVLPWQIYTDAILPPIRQAHAAAAATMLLLATVMGVLIQRRITRNAEKFVTILGKGHRSAPLALGPWKWAGFAFIWLYIILSTGLPLATLVFASLTQFTSQTLSVEMLTLRHYATFFTSENMRGALVNTLLLAVAASFVCMALGTVISYGEIRTRRLTPRMLALLCTLPVAVPGIVYGVGLHSVYLKTPLYGSLVVLFLAYVAKYIPYGVMVSRSSIVQIHPELEQCARTCGAGPVRVLAQITAPLIAGGLASIVFFVMLLSIKEISATLVLYTQRSEVLSVLTWSYMEAGEYQLAAVVAVVQTVLIVTLVLAVRLMFNIRLEAIGQKG